MGMKDTEDRVHVYDGKYIFVMNHNGTIREILRHGEPWPAGQDLIHTGVVLALVADLIEARHGHD